MPLPTEAPAFTDDQAASRFASTKSVDPFPDIPPTLLNSADIDDYVRSTGMISPYYPSKQKSASYEAQIGKLAIYWDSKGKLHEVNLHKVSDVKLQPNSLIYFMTYPFFRLPDYMVLRFNLRITNVHKGLLLGTGPLVDPGFEGRLLIPVHNFTTNAYSFKFGEDFIWIEFTKISPHEDWVSLTNEMQQGRRNRSGHYVPFPPDKKQDIGEPLHSIAKRYLAGAAPHRPLMNAIPEVNETAKSAQKTVSQLKLWGPIAFATTIIVAIIGLFLPIYSIIQGSLDLSVSTTDLIAETRANVKKYESEIAQLQEELDQLARRVEMLSNTERSGIKHEPNED